MIADPFTITDGHGVTIGGVYWSTRNGGSWATRCEQCERAGRAGRVTRIAGHRTATEALVSIAEHVDRMHPLTDGPVARLGHEEIQRVRSLTDAKIDHGADCTEEESAMLKRAFRALGPFDPLYARMVIAWPLEWSEIADEPVTR